MTNRERSMADGGKIFAGPRIKRFRRNSGMSQANLARDLGISPSYLNLIEHNQRAITAPLLIKLATLFELDLAQFDTGEEEQLLTDLDEVFSDPLLASSALGVQDRKQMVTEHPDWADLFIKLYRAFRSGNDNLSALASDRKQSGALAQLFEEPIEEVRDFFAANQNYFHTLDVWAEGRAQALGLKPGNRRSNLVQAIAQEFDYRVVERPARSLAPRQSLWDPHNRRLAVSLGIPSVSKAFRIAQIYCRLGARDLIETVIDQDPTINSARAHRIAVDGLVNYTAAALIFPYADFLSVAQQERFDVDAIADELGTSFEQTAHRLATLRRPGANAPAFFVLKIDAAGNVLKRLSNGGFGFPRHGNLCPAWSIFKARRTGGETLVSMVKTPNGQRFLTIARHQLNRQQETTFVMGCEARFVRQTAYGARVDLDREDLDEPIGPTCRLCSRDDCGYRAQPMY